MGYAIRSTRLRRAITGRRAKMSHRFVLAGTLHLPGGFDLTTITQAESARPITLTTPVGDRAVVNGVKTTLDQFRGTPFIQADLRVVTDSQYAFALNYFTGSKEHNIALRSRAVKLKNLSLNEYGFSPAAEKEKSAKELGSSIPCRTEEELYAAVLALLR